MYALSYVLSALFSDAVNLQGHMTLIISESMSMKHWRTDTDSKTEVPVLGEEPASVPLLITNLTRVDLGSKPGVCSETPATNRLSRGMVQYTRRHKGMGEGKLNTCTGTETLYRSYGQ